MSNLTKSAVVILSAIAAGFGFDISTSDQTSLAEALTVFASAAGALFLVVRGVYQKLVDRAR